MILGFAHITKNVPYERGLNAVANPPEKWPLMTRRATMHWLLLRRNGKGIQEETIEYDTGLVDQDGRLSLVDEDAIFIRARDVCAEVKWFRDGLGFADEPCSDVIGRVRFESVCPWWDFSMAILSDEGAPIDPPLDIAGYAALALYSNNVEADCDVAVAAGGRVPTEPFNVTVDGKNFKIVMLRSPEGTIIELIQVLK